MELVALQLSSGTLCEQRRPLCGPGCLQVVYWHWINNKTLGLVTLTSVFHWSIEGEGEPVKVFERTANLNGNQIISYRADPSGKWLVLIGTRPGAPEVRHSAWSLFHGENV